MIVLVYDWRHTGLQVEPEGMEAGHCYRSFRDRLQMETWLKYHHESIGVVETFETDSLGKPVRRQYYGEQDIIDVAEEERVDRAIGAADNNDISREDI